MSTYSYTKKIRIALVGRTPPPVGGVSSSILSIKQAVDEEELAEIRILRWSQLWKLLFFRPAVLHLNFSRPIKRFAGTLIGRIIGSRVIHTIHGNNFDFSIIWNALAFRFSHGFIILNFNLFDKFKAAGRKKIIQMTPILSSRGVINKPSPPIFDRDPGKVALVYANNKTYIDNEEVYGFFFISKLIPDLRARGYTIFFLDPSAAYTTEEIDSTQVGNIIHHRASVDFPHLLSNISIYLRPTSTDGNSVAVLEAMQAGVPVLASDAVPRPDGVITYIYGDADDFLSKIDAIDEVGRPPFPPAGAPPLSSARDYINFLNTL